MYLFVCLSLLTVCGVATAQDQGAQDEPFVIDNSKVYDVRDHRVDAQMTLKGVFDEQPKEVTIDRLCCFSNPVRVNDNPLLEVQNHFKWYRLIQKEREPLRVIWIKNQFGTRQRITIGRPVYLVAPAELSFQNSPQQRLDYYKFYEVIQGKCTPRLDKRAKLVDQFSEEKDALVRKPRYFGVPVEKTQDGETIQVKNADDYITVYDIDVPSASYGLWPAEDEFGIHDLAVGRALLVGMRSRMQQISAPEKLDYFKFYDVADIAVDEEFELIGQFDRQPLEHRISRLLHFANPVRVNDRPLIDKNAHLFFYRLHPAEVDAEDLDDPEELLKKINVEPVRTVRVWNQFGEQQLWLGRAKYLLTPCEKKEQGLEFPDDLDEYKCYTVLRSCGTYSHEVDLEDQFGREERVNVGSPILFCVPVALDGDWEDINNKRDHLTIYPTAHRKYDIEKEAEDKFGAQDLKIGRSVMLGAPSLKFEVFPPVPRREN
jgi:hypothetical protein